MLPKDKQPPQNTSHGLVCIQFCKHALNIYFVQDTRHSARCKEEGLNNSNKVIKERAERQNTSGGKKP